MQLNRTAVCPQFYAERPKIFRKLQTCSYLGSFEPQAEEFLAVM